MKYIVGYSTRSDSRFIDDIIRCKAHISEVYFSFGDFASGRKSLTDDGESTLFENGCFLCFSWSKAHNPV